jgi:hypothetical protein
LLLLGLAACAHTPLPCRAPRQCPEQSECLAHRCVPLGAEPVAAGSERLVLAPAGVAVVRAARADNSSAPPPTVTFGGPEPSNEQLLLRFPRNWAALHIDAAFLLLAPAPSADPTGADVQVQVALAAAPWTSGTLNRPPPVRSPKSSGLARTRPPSSLRLDVTAQMHALQQSPNDDHGLLVRAESSASRGATYLTGTDGELPRLDLYFTVNE